MRSLTIFLLALFLFAGAVCFAETHIPAGDVFGVWEAAGSPYYIDGEIHIPTDNMLVIEPGCSIIFTGHYKFCVDSNAVFKAMGTETDSVFFTPQYSFVHWYGIKFNSSAEGCTLSYCRIEYSDSSGIYCSNSSPIITNNSISGNSAGWNGGGICCNHSSPTITKNTITENSAGYGGGIYCVDSNPTITNNTISGNSAEDGGGGIYCYDNSSPTIENNTISGNSAGESGSGIYCYESSPTIANNTISGNSAEDGGGGIYCYYSSPTIENNTISGNSASNYGGGICYDGESSPTITNNTITGNSADYGGGIFCFESDPTITNNTINGNSAEWDGGGIYCCRNSDPTIFNTIVWQNTASSGNEICIRYFGFGGTPYPCTLFVAYTNIDPGECYVEGDTAGEIIWGDGNINTDPLFADTLFHLSAGSPCIDVGAESVYVSIWDTVIYAPEYDFEGGVRPYGAGWDIGADEYGSSIIAEHSESKPRSIEIFAYPNPFNSSVVITVSGGRGLASQTLTNIEVYDIMGNVVYAPSIPRSLSPRGERDDATVWDGSESPSPWGEGFRMRGKYIWQPDKSIASGIYLVRATTEDGQTITKRIVYLK